MKTRYQKTEISGTFVFMDHKCRVCDGVHLSLALDLGLQPYANLFLKQEEIGKEPVAPLQLYYCHSCQTAQLGHTVKKETIYADHTYLSGITTSLNDHFAYVSQEIDRTFFKDKKEKCALDIGSNDGTQLKHFQSLGYEVLGVEAAKTIAEIANKQNIPTRHAFFNFSEAKKIDKKFDVINAAGVFFHLEELHSCTEGIRFLLKEEGVFVVQFLYMKCIMENGAFDQIYHEHLLFYTLKTIEHLLNIHGLTIFDAFLSPIHGGSIIAYVSHKGKRQNTCRFEKLKKEEELSSCNAFETYLAFAKRIQTMKEKNLSYLALKKEEGKKIFGLGAPVKGNTLLNTFGIGRKYLDCLIEKNYLRKNLFSPGQHLPIYLEDELENPPDVYYVLAWNFKTEILKRNQKLIEQGVEFYFPIEI